MGMRIRAVLLIGISLVAISGNAVAQSASTAMPSSKTDAANAPTAQATAPRPSRPEIPASDRDIIVTAPLQQSETDVLQGTSVLKGEALTRDLRPSLGEMLSRLPGVRSEEHTSELQSLMPTSYAGFCLKKKTYTPKRKT